MEEITELLYCLDLNIVGPESGHQQSPFMQRLITLDPFAEVTKIFSMTGKQELLVFLFLSDDWIE